MYYLVFYNYIEQMKGYDVSLEDASHNEILYDYIIKK